MALQPVNIYRVASKLDRPFHLVPLARVEDFAAMVFVCQGAVAWHSHEDQDEMFFVQTGEMVLETGSGPLTLTPGQIAVVPRGVTHRSHAETPSVVMLFERTSPAGARNGHRRFFVSGVETAFSKVDLAETARGLAGPFHSALVAQVNDFAVWMCRAEGTSSYWHYVAHAVLIFVVKGQVSLEVVGEAVMLNGGDLIVIPRGTPHRLYAPAQSHLLFFANALLELGTGSL